MPSRLLGCWQGDIEASDDKQAARVLAGGYRGK